MRKSYGLKKRIKHFHVSITIHLLYHCPGLKVTLATFIMHITVLVLYIYKGLFTFSLENNHKPATQHLHTLASLNQSQKRFFTERTAGLLITEELFLLFFIHNAVHWAKHT